jgi:hypothetical protein
MSCPLRRRDGSGYVKPSNTELAKANEDAFTKLLADRAILDVRLAAAWAPAPPPEEAAQNTLKKVGNGEARSCDLHSNLHPR